MVKKKKNKESLEFQAEVSKLLDLVANSLYSEREIFLRELISNASDACEKLRYLAVSKKGLLGNEKDLKINIRVSKKNKIIEVEDNGIGMSSDNLTKIFNPFFTTKDNGTGLGLSISHNIIKAHQGTIDAVSEEGKGTSFTVKIPSWDEGFDEK